MWPRTKSPKQAARFPHNQTPAEGGIVPNLTVTGAPQPTGREALLFVSMHCADCIDLLPELGAISLALPDYPLSLFTTGDREDIKEMRAYFGWTFPIYSIDPNILHLDYGIQSLPYAILTEDGGRIAVCGIVQEEAEIRSLAARIWKGGDRNGMRLPIQHV